MAILLQDNFNDGVIDTAKWVESVDPPLSQSETTVLIQFDPGVIGTIFLESRDTFTAGDVEMNIGWAIPTFAWDLYSRFQIRMTDGHIFEMRRRDGVQSLSKRYEARYFDGTTWTSLAIFDKGVSSAKLRIKRTGSTIEGFYSEDGGATWTLLGTKTGASTANFKIRIQTNGADWTVHWDNFVLSGADTAALTVAITSTASDPTNVSPIPMTATFSEPVTGFVEADISVTNGAVTANSFATTDNTTFTFSVTPTADGVVLVDIAAGVATNAAGNPNTAAPQFSITYDTTALAVTIDPVITPTNLNMQTITGIMEAGATVTMSSATATFGAVTTPTATTWSVVATLAEGINAITATATDGVGNTGTTTTMIILNIITLTFFPEFGLEEDINFSTIIFRTGKGKEKRRAKWSRGIRTLTCHLRYENKNTVDFFWNFYKARRGAFDTFWTKFPTEKKIVNEAVATGNGMMMGFDLVHFPVDTASAKVYFDGVEQTTGWTAANDLTLEKAQLLFSVAPGAGVVITADYEFYFQVRFMEDRLNRVLMAYKLLNMGIKLREVLWDKHTVS